MDGRGESCFRAAAQRGGHKSRERASGERRARETKQEGKLTQLAQCQTEGEERT